MGNPRNAYFADHNYLSNSMLKTFDKKPSLYEALFVTHSMPSPPPTDPMIVGSMTHTLVFEPEKIADDWAVHDFNPRSGGAWKAYVKEHADKMLFRRQDMTNCEAIAAAVRADTDARKFLNAPNSEAEKEIRWEQDGITRKAKVDLFIPLHSKHCVLCDLKTTADSSPKTWEKQCRNMNYHRQAAWYCDAARSLGYTQIEWFYIIVETDPPHDVYVTRATEEELMDGEIENNETLRRWVECRDTGIWKRPEQIGVWDNPVPAWA